MKDEFGNVICRSIFKNNKDTISKEQFTKVWIEMINKIEKGKSVNFLKK